MNKCEHEDSQYYGQECECYNCNDLRVNPCVDMPCYLCEGPVIECDKEATDD